MQIESSAPATHRSFAIALLAGPICSRTLCIALGVFVFSFVLATGVPGSESFWTSATARCGASFARPQRSLLPAGPRAQALATIALQDAVQGQGERQGGRLGVQIVDLRACNFCRVLGLQVGDVITHLSSNAGTITAPATAPATTALTPTPNLLAWQHALRTLPGPSLTVRLLRAGRPVLLSRVLERAGNRHD